MIAELELARIATDIERTWAAYDERAAYHFKRGELEESLQAMQESTRLIQEEKRVRAEIEVDHRLVCATWRDRRRRTPLSIWNSWRDWHRSPQQRDIVRWSLAESARAEWRSHRAPGDSAAWMEPQIAGWHIPEDGGP